MTLSPPGIHTQQQRLSVIILVLVAHGLHIPLVSSDGDDTHSTLPNAV